MSKRSWNVPVNGTNTTISEIPEKDCELCAKCKSQLGVQTFRGSKPMMVKMADPEEGEVRRRMRKSFYYCSSECLEAHGSVDDGDFSF